MIVAEQRIIHDLFGLEIAQIDDGDTPVGFIADEQPLPVVIAVGLA
jgi:hypothetical protein